MSDSPKPIADVLKDIKGILDKINFMKESERSKALEQVKQVSKAVEDIVKRDDFAPEEDLANLDTLIQMVTDTVEGDSVKGFNADELKFDIDKPDESLQKRKDAAEAQRMLAEMKDLLELRKKLAEQLKTRSTFKKAEYQSAQAIQKEDAEAKEQSAKQRRSDLIAFKTVISGQVHKVEAIGKKLEKIGDLKKTIEDYVETYKTYAYYESEVDKYEKHISGTKIQNDEHRDAAIDEMGKLEGKLEGKLGTIRSICSALDTMNITNESGKKCQFANKIPSGPKVSIDIFKENGDLDKEIKAAEAKTKTTMQSTQRETMSLFNADKMEENGCKKTLAAFLQREFGEFDFEKDWKNFGGIYDGLISKAEVEAKTAGKSVRQYTKNEAAFNGVETARAEIGRIDALPDITEADAETALKTAGGTALPALYDKKENTWRNRYEAMMQCSGANSNFAVKVWNGIKATLGIGKAAIEDQNRAGEKRANEKRIKAIKDKKTEMETDRATKRTENEKIVADAGYQKKYTTMTLQEALRFTPSSGDTKNVGEIVAGIETRVYNKIVEDDAKGRDDDE